MEKYAHSRLLGSREPSGNQVQSRSTLSFFRRDPMDWLGKLLLGVEALLSIVPAILGSFLPQKAFPIPKACLYFSLYPAHGASENNLAGQCSHVGLSA